jgi:hypothetical protein
LRGIPVRLLYSQVLSSVGEVAGFQQGSLALPIKAAETGAEKAQAKAIAIKNLFVMLR